MLADSFVTDLLKLILINVVLSCDNALLIALVCRNLPPQVQKKAYWWGSIGTVVLKVGLTFVAAKLLLIPYLQAAGGLMLGYIAVGLLRQGEDRPVMHQQSHLWKAVQTIMIADLVMSIDNTVAVAAIAGGDLLLISIGFVISVPLILFGADVVTKLMERIPSLISLSAAFLGYAAWEMVRKDRAVGPMLTEHLATLEALIPWLIVASLLLYGRKQAARVVTVPFFKSGHHRKRHVRPDRER